MAAPQPLSFAAASTSPSSTTNSYSQSAAPVVGLPPFFAVSLYKLVIMSVCTLGFYPLYWFYCHWRLILVWGGNAAFSPALRTSLLPFYCIPLFRRVRTLDIQVNGQSGLFATSLAIGYILVNLLDLLPGLWSVLSLTSVVFLLPMQACANRLNEQLCPATFDRNTSIRGWDWLVVVLGVVLLILTIVAGLYE